MNIQGIKSLQFTLVWKKTVPEVAEQVKNIWRNVVTIPEAEIEQRINELVYVIETQDGRVVGISTALKLFVPQLRNHFYAFRCLLIPGYRIPGLTSKLVVMTRDFLEAIHQTDGEEKAIGVITVVENEEIKKHRTEAVWPASQMIYIGNTKSGNHIRLYYFKGARIAP